MGSQATEMSELLPGDKLEGNLAIRHRGWKHRQALLGEDAAKGSRGGPDQDPLQADAGLRTMETKALRVIRVLRTGEQYITAAET